MKKVCVITGATSGIGYAVAKGLAQKHYTLVLVGRDAEKGRHAVKTLIRQTNNFSIQFYTINLSSLTQIKVGGESIQREYPVIDILINNAAQWTSKYELTEDGVETQFAVNHLAYFLFTHLLYPSLVKSADARIINIGSDSHRYGKINFTNYNLENEYHGLKAYGQSKLANLLFSYEFNRRKLHDHVSVYCVQPGLVKTDIGIKHTNPFHSLMWKLRRLGGITAEKAASYIVYLASSAEVKKHSGLYWDAGKPKPSSIRSRSEEDASRLWTLSEKLCGITEYFKRKL